MIGWTEMTTFQSEKYLLTIWYVTYVYFNRNLQLRFRKNRKPGSGTNLSLAWSSESSSMSTKTQIEKSEEQEKLNLYGHNSNHGVLNSKHETKENETFKITR